MNSIQSYHNTLSEHLRNIDRNILKYLSFSIPSIASLLTISKFSILANILIYIFSMVFLSWGLFYILALSYTYRYLIVVMSKIEQDIGLSKYTGPWISNSNPNSRDYENILHLFSLSPSSLRIHAIIYLIFIWLYEALAILMIFSDKYLYTGLPLIISLIAIYLAHYKYPKKLKKIFTPKSIIEVNFKL